MELEYIDISQHGEEKRASGNRNYVSGSVVRADGPAVGNQYRKRTTAPERSASGCNQRQSRPASKSGSKARRENPQKVRRTPEEIERRRQMILQKKKRKRQRRIIKGIILLCETAFIVLLCLLLYQFIRSFRVSSKDMKINAPEEKEVVRMIEENESQKPLMTEDFLLTIYLFIIRPIKGQAQHKTGVILKIWESPVKLRQVHILLSAMTERSYSVFP